MSLNPPVAIITEEFPPRSGGGIAEWAYGLARSFTRLGHEVTVLSKWKGRVDPRAHEGEGFILWPMKGHDWHRWRVSYSLYYLHKWARRYPGGLLIAATWPLARAAVLIKRHYPLTVILLTHGLEITRLRRNGEIRRLKHVLERSDVIVAVSRFTKGQILKRVPLNPDRIKVIPPGVDLKRFRRDEDFQTLRERWNLRRNQPILLTLARVIARKGHDTVIKSLSWVLREFPEVKYIIAGPWSTSVYRHLQEMIVQLGLTERVIFTGFIEDRELNKLYSMADIYVMVSRELEDVGDTEGFGITFLEANACEIPVIGSHSGGIPDAIQEGYSGFLVQPDDPEELSRKILYLLKNPEIARQMGKNGRKRIQKGYTWQRVTECLLREIEELQNLP